MRGHEAIIKMRLEARRVPPAAFVLDVECQPGFCEYGSPYPNVSIHGDYIENLDFRFLVNMHVHATATTEERAIKLFDKIRAVQPAMLSVCHTGATYNRDSWLKVWSKELGMIYG